MLYQLPVLIPVIHHAVFVFYIRIKLVVTQLETYILQYQQTGRHTDGKPHDIERRKYFIPHQVAPGALQIIFYHSYQFFYSERNDLTGLRSAALIAW
jgi:hypothetical protein